MAGRDARETGCEERKGLEGGSSASHQRLAVGHGGGVRAGGNGSRTRPRREDRPDESVEGQRRPVAKPELRWGSAARDAPDGLACRSREADPRGLPDPERAGPDFVRESAEQPRAKLGPVPRTHVDRVGPVVVPRHVDERSAVLAGERTESILEVAGRRHRLLEAQAAARHQHPPDQLEAERGDRALGDRRQASDRQVLDVPSQGRHAGLHPREHGVYLSAVEQIVSYVEDCAPPSARAGQPIEDAGLEDPGQFAPEEPGSGAEGASVARGDDAVDRSSGCDPGRRHPRGQRARQVARAERDAAGSRSWRGRADHGAGVEATAPASSRRHGRSGNPPGACFLLGPCPRLGGRSAVLEPSDALGPAHRAGASRDIRPPRSTVTRDPRTSQVLTGSLFALAAAFTGCTTPNVPLVEAEAFYARSDYFQAYVAAQRARELAPDDPEVARIHARAREAYLLWDAQRLVFLSEEEAALARLDLVLAKSPDHPIAIRWRDKARLKLAERAVDLGNRMLASGKLEDAQGAFGDAYRWVPDYAPAGDGLERLASAAEGLRTEARGHYVDGVRALGEYEYRQTAYHLGIAVEKDPELTAAQDPLAIAKRQIAEERYASAQAMQEAGFYRPALLEYRALAEQFPDLFGLAERIAVVETEAEVVDLADAGEIAVYRGEFDKARELLDTALAKTTTQTDMVSERLLLVREREIESEYIAAKDLELQLRLEEAIVAYVALAESAAGFRDVAARIEDLRQRVEAATSSYRTGVQAEERGERDAAIEAFTDVQLFWPGYRDARDRLDALRKQKLEGGGSR